MNDAGSFCWTGGGLLFGYYLGFLGRGALAGNSLVLGIAIALCVFGAILSGAGAKKAE